MKGERGVEKRGRDRSRRTWGREGGSGREKRKGIGKVAN